MLNVPIKMPSQKNIVSLAMAMPCLCIANIFVFL
jgi:hypothetical protein